MVNITTLKTSIVIVLVALSNASQASALKCFDLFNPPATEVIDAPSRFTVRSLIPKGFLDEVERALGPVAITTSRFEGFKGPGHQKKGLIGETKDIDRENEKNYTSVSIQITAGHEIPFLTFQMAFENSAPQRLRVAFLEITNPLLAKQSDPVANNDAYPLHQTQTSKGVPYHVLVEIRERLFAYLLSKGIRHINVPGASDYTVSLLYRRMMGFTPANPRATEIYQAVDKAYENAKKLPPGVKPRSLDEFSRSLLHTSSDDMAFFEVNLQLSEYFASGKLIPTTRLFNDKNGDLFALVENYGLKNQKVYYVDPKTKKLLFWRELTGKFGTELELDLIP